VKGSCCERVTLVAYVFLVRIEQNVRCGVVGSGLRAGLRGSHFRKNPESAAVKFWRRQLSLGIFDHGQIDLGCVKFVCEIGGLRPAEWIQNPLQYGVSKLRLIC
jgi:hypothetical protein